MFEVERSSAERITVRDYDDGHLWVFDIAGGLERNLAVREVVENADARHAPDERSAKARSFAELEAWKRGLID